MKKIAVLLLAVATLAAACKNNKEGDDHKGADSGATAATGNFKMTPEAEHDLKIFRKAWAMADPYTAVYALNSYLMHDSSNLDLKDTLAQLYVELNQPIAALKIIGEVLDAKPNDTAMLQMHYTLATSIGQPEKAASSSKKLHELFPNDLQYKVAYAHSMLMNPSTSKEAEKMLLEVINDPNSVKQSTTYNDVENGRQVQKKLTLKVAALMLLGEAYGSNGDIDKGEEYFREALKTDRNFQPALDAIRKIKQIRAQGGR